MFLLIIVILELMNVAWNEILLKTQLQISLIAAVLLECYYLT